MKYLKAMIITLGIIPYGVIISLLTFYFHAGSILGRLPTYSNPDPKELPVYDTYYQVIETTGEVWFYSLFVWLILVPVYLIVSRKNISWKPVLFSIIGQVAGVILFLSEITNWYMD
jgi:hypothetical protein